jgi:glutaconate CoA-transferase subunit A
MRDKVMSLSDAAALIASGSVLGLGGLMLRRHPMALIREIIRQGKRDLTLQTWVGGIDVDLLVGAGCAKRIEAAYEGLGPLGSAPNVRRAAESGAVTIEDFSETSMISRFRAAAMGIPFMPTRVLKGTSMAEQENVRPIVDPFSGEKLHAVAAAKPDVAIFHGYWADCFGNVQAPPGRNSDDVDTTIAKAAGKVIVTVEKIVRHEDVIRRPTLTYIPHHWVTAVVEVPTGAHPGNCDTLYEPDFDALEAYLEAARDPAKFRGWLDRHIFQAKTHEEYLALATTPGKLAASGCGASHDGFELHDQRVDGGGAVAPSPQ